MIAEIKSAQLLTGLSRQRAAARGRNARGYVLSRVSLLVADHADRIAEDSTSIRCSSAPAAWLLPMR